MVFSRAINKTVPFNLDSGRMNEYRDLRRKKWDIYYIYGVLSGYIQQYSPETEAEDEKKNADVEGLYCWL